MNPSELNYQIVSTFEQNDHRKINMEPGKKWRQFLAGVIGKFQVQKMILCQKVKKFNEEEFDKNGFKHVIQTVNLSALSANQGCLLFLYFNLK